MEELKIIISLTSASLGLLITLLTYLYRFSKNKKIKEKALEIITLTNKLIPYIKEAEMFTNYSGIEKKEYVLTKIRQFAYIQKIDLDETEITKQLEEMIILTKEVNKRKINKPWLET